MSDEHRFLRNLIRVVSGLAGWTALSIALVMAFIDLNEHALHIGGLLPFGLVAVTVFFLADRLAVRFATSL